MFLRTLRLEVLPPSSSCLGGGLVISTLVALLRRRPQLVLSRAEVRPADMVAHFLDGPEKYFNKK